MCNNEYGSKHNYEKAQLISEEKRDHKMLVLSYEKSLIHVFLAFIALIGTAIGLVIKEGASENTQIRNYIIIAITQAEFILSIIGSLLIHAIAMVSGYIRSLEKEINFFMNDKIVFYEHEITKRFVSEGKGVYFYLSIIIGTILIILYILMIIMCFRTLNSILFLIIATAEIIVAGAAYALALTEVKRVESQSDKIFHSIDR